MVNGSDCLRCDPRDYFTVEVLVVKLSTLLPLYCFIYIYIFDKTLIIATSSRWRSLLSETVLAFNNSCEAVDTTLTDGMEKIAVTLTQMNDQFKESSINRNDTDAK